MTEVLNVTVTPASTVVETTVSMGVSQSELTAETTRALAAEATNATAIASNSTAITTETARATAAEAAIRTPTDDGYDIWILAGQSNMLGVDPAFALTTDPVHPRVYEWPPSGANAGLVIQATDPLVFPLGSGQLGPGMTFARWMADAVTPLNRRILLVPCAESTTGFEHPPGGANWDVTVAPGPNGLYQQALSLANAALAAVSIAGGTSRVAGVLWSQGEEDSLFLTDANNYATHLDALIAGFRSNYGANLPFIIISMEPAFVVDNVATGSAVVNAAHIDTPRRNYNTGFAYGPAGMSLQGGGYGTDTHYTAAGQRINGQRAFEAFVRSQKNVLGTAPTVPTGLSIVQSGANILASWKQNPGRVTDYTLQYRVTGTGPWTTVTRTSPSGAPTNIDVTGTQAITDGTSYDFQVRAINEQGTSAFCAFVTLLTVTIPGQVVGLTTGTATSTSMPLTWTATAGATSYLVQYKAHSSGTWLTFATVFTNASTVTALLSSVSYDFQVQAVNNAGSGTFSTTATASTTTATPVMSDIGVSAARAYGVRLLVSGYAGNCLRVRRDSDNTTQDIGFVSGYIDTASLLTFVGAGSGFVNIWYDQSGNTRNLTQAVAANQPLIVSAGALNLINGRLGFNFNGTSNLFTDTSPGMYAAGSASVLMVAESLATTTGNIVNESRTVTSNSLYIPFAQVTGQVFMQIETDAATFPLNAIATKKINDALHQLSFVDTGTVAEQWVDATAASTGAVSYTRGTTTLSNFSIGGAPQVGVTHWANVFVAEVLVFYSNLTTVQRQAGEANQKAFFVTP